MNAGIGTATTGWLRVIYARGEASIHSLQSCTVLYLCRPLRTHKRKVGGHAEIVQMQAERPVPFNFPAGEITREFFGGGWFQSARSRLLGRYDASASCTSVFRSNAELKAAAASARAPPPLHHRILVHIYTPNGFTPFRPRRRMCCS